MPQTLAKRQLRAEETRQKILAAAEKQFSLLGFYGARMDEIAAEAGANKRMIYEYFGNKEELYKLVLRRVYLLLGTNEEQLFACVDPSTPADAIGQLVRLYFTFLHQNPTYVRMLMWENLNEARYFATMNMDDSRNPIKKLLHDIIKQGQESGVFRSKVDESHVLMTLFACPFNYFSNRYTLQRIMEMDFAAPEEIDRRIQFTTDFLLAYLSNTSNSLCTDIKSRP